MEAEAEAVAEQEEDLAVPASPQPIVLVNPASPSQPQQRKGRRLSIGGLSLGNVTPRKQTLEKYVQAVKQQGGNTASLDRGFKFRLQAKQRGKYQVEKSLTRAKTLRQGFFDGVDRAEFIPPATVSAAVAAMPAHLQTPPRPVATPQREEAGEEDEGASFDVRKLDSFAEMKQAAQKSALLSPRSSATAAAASKSATSWGDYLSNIFRPTTSSSPLQQTADALSEALEMELEEHRLEEELQAETMHLHKQQQLADADEQARITQIRAMLGKLTEVQDTKISEFQRQCTKLDKQLRAHAKYLETQIHAGKFFGEDALHNVVDLRDELRNILLHLDNLQLESVFPTCLRWKLKAKIEDGMFVGVRDLDIARFDAGKFSIEANGSTAGEDGRLVFSMSEVRLDLALYEFDIRGDTAKTKVLRSALASALNRVELCMTGEGVLPLVFEEGGTGAGRTAHSRWVAAKDGAVFKMRLVKTSDRPRTAFQLPDSFLQWFASSLIPSLVETQILATLPTRGLGQFLTKSDNRVKISGRFEICGDTTPQVWKAPLVSSDRARAQLGFASEDEAFIFDYCLRSVSAQNAGFDAGTTTSLAKLYAWRLRFAAHSLASLAPLLALIEQGSNLRGIPKNWMLQLLRRVDELAAKPMTISIHLNEVELDLDVKELLTVVTSVYLEHVEENAAKEMELEAARAARRKMRASSVSKQQQPQHDASSHPSHRPEEALRLAKEAVAKLHANFDRIFVPLLRDEFRTQFNAMIAGGSGGLLAFSFTDVLADVCLPTNFSFSLLLFEAVELYQGFILKVNGSAAIEEGEYGFRLNVLPVGEEEDEDAVVGENDVETAFKNVKLDLFPTTRGKPAGFIHVSMDAWKSTILISSLIKFILSMSPPTTTAPPASIASNAAVLSKEELQQRRVSRNAAQTESAKELLIQTRRVVENLWGSFRLFEMEMENETAAVQAGIAGVNPLNNVSGRRESLHEVAAAAVDEEELRQRVLMPYLTNDSFAMHLDVRGLQLSLKRTEREGMAAGTRLKLVNKPEQTQTLVSFSVRLNLQDVFQSDILLPV